MSVKEALTNIANAIRKGANLPNTKKLTLEEMPKQIEAVKEAGAKTEYDSFWDAFQYNGTRTKYGRAFASIGWTNETFKPKYDIICGDNCNGMFDYTNTIKGDLDKILKDMGRKLDTKGATNLSEAFRGMGRTTKLPYIDLSGCGAKCDNTFTSNNGLTEIVGIKFNGYYGANMIYNCPQLVKFKAEGFINQGTIDLRYSTKLNKQTIKDLINILSDNPYGTYTVTFSKKAIDDAFEEPHVDADGFLSEPTIGTETTEWNNLIKSKSKWRFVLV